MKQQKGFTLIELLVVIAIIGLLSTLAVVSLNNARQKSRDAKRVSDIKQIQTALELYYNDSTTGYPATAGVTSGSPIALGSTTYMGSVPTAPTPADGTCTNDAVVGTGNTYTYIQTGSGTGYTLTYCLGAATGGITAGFHTASSTAMF